VLTLSPGGAFDYASGSSLAAAHLSGGAALLRSVQPGLRAGALQSLLDDAGATVDLCGALRRLRPEMACAD
jgi:subtilisin family serine protease